MQGPKVSLAAPVMASRHIALFIVFLYCTAFGGGSSTNELRERFEAISKTANGKVGVAVELFETGETIALNGRDRFPMQSVYKLPIAMAVLRRADEGAVRLDQTMEVTTNDLVPKAVHSPLRDAHPFGAELSISNLLRAMILESDGTASDVLLRLLDGPPSVDRYLRDLGLTNVAVAITEKEMDKDEFAQYRNWATPEGIIELLRSLQEGRGISASNREELLRLLTETATGPSRIKGLLPPGTPVAHKTGSSRTVNGMARATNDAGIVTLPDGRHILIAVFVSDSTADEDTREAVIAKISRAAWDYWREKGR